MKHLDDINSEISQSLPHTEVTFQVKRHGSRVAKMNVTTKNTFKYDNNEQFTDDLTRLLTNLIGNNFSGTIQLNQTFKNGQVVNMTVKNTKINRYR